MVGVIASNRLGDELNNNIDMNFYGHSLIINETGEVVKEMNSDKEGYASYAFDLESLQNKRSEWGLFRDRREDLYTTAIN